MTKSYIRESEPVADDLLHQPRPLHLRRELEHVFLQLRNLHQAVVWGSREKRATTTAKSKQRRARADVFSCQSEERAVASALLEST